MTARERLAEIRESVDQALTRTAQLTGGRGGSALPDDASRLQESLEDAIDTLRGWSGSDPARTVAASEVVSELALLAVSLQAHEVVRRRESVARLNTSLHRLQEATSLHELADAIPIEVAKLGFHRVMFSWVDQLRWVPESFHTVNGPEEARAVMDAGSPPYWHIGRLLERQMVEHRRPMLVRNALDNPHVHLDIQAVMQTTSYVAAPVLRGSRVVAFLHADQNVESGEVDEVDRDVMQLFAGGVSLALDRVASMEEITSFRARMGEQLASLTDAVAMLGGHQPAPPRQTTAATTAPASAWDPLLTRREEQVLELVAAGLTNAQIAERLYISEGTVKTHVKNLLRKLDAENRAHAAAMYRGRG